MKAFKCECCGGDINRATMKCEYCGTQYKEDYDNGVIRIETFRNPIDHYTAVVTFCDEHIHNIGPEKISEIAVKELSHKLADCIAQNMVVTHRHEPWNRTHYIKGDIKVVRPVQGADKWRIGDD